MDGEGIGVKVDQVGAQAAATSHEILQRLLGGGEAFDLAVRLWDGSWWPAETQAARTTLVFTHPGALRRMLGYPLDVAMGEAFIRGDFQVEGDLEAAFRVIQQRGRPSPREVLALGRLAARLPKTEPPAVAPLRPARLWGAKHSPQRDRQAIAHHYNVGNDFFRLWLDRRMVYSCAYFPTGAEDLDAAQAAKLDLICRKLRLRPGERLLDVGCGWGGLVMYAAERCGAAAVGVTLSGPQAELAAQRIKEAGLASRCRVEIRDYRDLAGERFDKAASVGMFEHVGRQNLPAYFAAVFSALRPGGLFLNHGISGGGRTARQSGAPTPSFIDRYVFPDGELVPVSDALRAAEAAGLEVRDVESLREHYALTLRHWVRRLEARRAEAVAAVGEGTFRTWRLFMAASAHGFATGQLNVYQALLVKPDEQGRSGLPLTRADMYV